MIIFLYLILVLAWALLIIVLKCKKARAKRLAELQEEAQPVHVVQIGSNLYDIMSIQHSQHRPPYGTMYDCLGTGSGATGTGTDHCHHTHASSRSLATHSITHSNAAFVGDDGCVYPGSTIPPLEPPPSYDEVIRLPAYYPKVETFVPEMVVPPPASTATSNSTPGTTSITTTMNSNGMPATIGVTNVTMSASTGNGRVKTVSTVT